MEWRHWEVSFGIIEELKNLAIYDLQRSKNYYRFLYYCKYSIRSIRGIPSKF